MSAPSRLGRYPVRRRIGSGAFATVWLAYDEHLDSPVAIKVLADNWTEDFHVRQRFLEEGRFLRKVESPHVVTVYDAGELADGRPYLVMCYADEGTLADRIELSTLTPSQALHVVSQVGRGLSALHHRGVLHRDVKPANVLFRTVGAGRSTSVVAMLGDLGLGKAMDMSSRLTMIGGTPSYVAPEQARGESLDGRADQYSLAALTFSLLTGRPPYDHPSLSAAAHPPEPPGMGTEVPDDVEAVVRRGLSPDREDRFDEVEEYVAALEAAMGASGGVDRAAAPGWLPTDPDRTRTEPRPEATTAVPAASLATGVSSVPGTTEPRRRRWYWLVAAAVALGLGGAGGWALEQARSSPQTVQDAEEAISLTVPEEWTQHVAPQAWTPEGAEKPFPSLSAGSTEDWNSAEDPAPGVFVGVLAGEDLPGEVPQHDDACQESRSPVEGESEEGDQMITQQFRDCAGADVLVERVIQATGNRLVWVQVRAEDPGTARDVLASLELRL